MEAKKLLPVHNALVIYLSLVLTKNPIPVHLQQRHLRVFGLPWPSGEAPGFRSVSGCGFGAPEQDRKEGEGNSSHTGTVK